MSYDMMTLETAGPVATVTMNRPAAYNAFTKPMRAELLAALQEVDAKPDVRVCILKGAGKGFSAGNDIVGDVTYDDVTELIVGEYLPIMELISRSDMVFIAQVHGRAAGIAAALAMSCDFVVMAEDSALSMAFAAIALTPDGGASYHLMNSMGYRRALEAIVEGRSLPASDCLTLGIANRVHPADALDSETQAWAESLAARAPLATAAAKRVLRAMGGTGFADVVRAEAAEQNKLIRSRDFARGVAAFKERRTPVFQGD